MFKVTALERGLAAEKRELAKMKKIKITDEEMKELNKIVHNTDIIEEPKAKPLQPVVVKKKDITYFYCCCTYWPDGIQCPVCGNSADDY